MVARNWIFPLASCLFVLMSSSCGGQSSATLPTSTSTAIASPTATYTSTPIPTETPTMAPTQTPVGGTGKLILGTDPQQIASSDNEYGVYLYDLSTRQITLLFEGFSLLGKASADGTKILLYRQTKEETRIGELYIANISGSDPVLLHDHALVGQPNAVTWLPGTNWIAFLANVQNTIQVFVIHLDGTGLTQVTNSKIGAGEILPAFDGGIYWEEAQIRTRGYYSYGYRWTKLDGSETKELDWFRPAISLDGKNVAFLPEIPALQQGPSNFVISKLDGANSTTISIETLQLPKTDFPAQFWDFAWLSNDKGVLAQIALCSSGEPCTNKYYVFSTDGKMLKEFPETILPGDTMSWFVWLDGDWSPDARLYVYQKVNTDENGKYTQTPLILDVETMKTESLEIQLDDGFTITRIFWLSSEK